MESVLMHVVTVKVGMNGVGRAVPFYITDLDAPSGYGLEVERYVLSLTERFAEQLGGRVRNIRYPGYGYDIGLNRDDLFIRIQVETIYRNNPLTHENIPARFEDLVAALKLQGEPLVVGDTGPALAAARATNRTVISLIALAIRLKETRYNRGHGLLQAAIAALYEGKAETSLALIAGVEDKSYHTPSVGHVDRYEGVGEVIYPDGRRFKVEGYRPRGNPYYIEQQGGIRWTEINSV